MVLTIGLSVLLSIFSTTVMSYIAMATPLGPWIAPTLVLMSMAVLRLLQKHTDVPERMVLAIAAGSIGGILATACAFAFTTLYFLSSDLFNSWLHRPLIFIGILGGLSFCAGWLGIWLANAFAHRLIIEDALPFPIGNMVYKVIAAQAQLAKMYELFQGFFATLAFCILRNDVGPIRAIIPKVIPLIPALSIGMIHIPAISISLVPIFWAIGFVTGLTIVGSLAFGSLSKIVVLEPIRQFFFPQVDSMEFVLAFCSGMVVAGVLHSFLYAPKVLAAVAKKAKGKSKGGGLAFLKAISHEQKIELIGVLVCIFFFLRLFNFGFVLQLYLIFFSAVCAYQIAIIAGKIGLAQLGRFATFVMVPAIFLFKMDYVQTAMLATFVEVCSGVMTDALFGKKLGYLSDVSQEKIRKYQYFGLIVSSIVVGIVFWLLLTRFQLGGAELFAQRAQARALLIKAQHFNFYVLIVGLLFGLLLKFTPFSPMLVLGGILMPLPLTFGFVGGALLTLCVKDPQEWVPFCSGVFAANSIWMIVQAFVRHLA